MKDCWMLSERANNIGGWIAVAIFFGILLVGGARSQQGSPRESEHKTEASQSSDQKSQGVRHLLAPTTIVTPAPIVNVYAGKHASEESHCAKPKDWKEWGWFPICRSVEWLDAERVIAIWTVILGIATFALFLATRGLVKDARNATDRQAKETKILQRAYIRAIPLGIDSATDQYLIGHVSFENVGKLPATNFRWTVQELTEGDASWIPPQLTDDDLTEYSSFIPIGGEFRRGTERSIPLTSEDKYWFVWGRVKYLDGFGNERFVDFCHSYPIARRIHNPSTEPLFRSTPEIGYSIDVKYGRYHDHGNNGD